jgi:hypothetical protein
VFFIVQDQDAVSTPETLDIVLYPEDPANPGLPLISGAVTFATGVTGPGAPATGVISAAVKTVTPAAPVAVPILGGGDVFVSWRLPASPTASVADGLSIQALNGNSAAPTAVQDVQGPNGQPLTPASQANSYGITYNPGAATLTYSVARVWFLDVAHNGTGGAALTVTNQTTLLGSNNPPPVGFGPAPGTASFMSGSAPDVNGFSAGRADDITFDYFRSSTAGNIVLFLLDLGAFGPELPTAGFLPGSNGVLCLNLSTFWTAGFSIADPTGEAFMTTVFSTASRPALLGLPILQQAAELDGAIIHASPCAKQTL